MDKVEITKKVKKIIKQSLEDIEQVKTIEDDTPLIGTEVHPGIFENSLCVLEVTSGLVTEFDVDPSIFNKESFKDVRSLVDTIYTEMEKNNK